MASDNRITPKELIERQAREILQLRKALEQIARMDPEWNAQAPVEVAREALAALNAK